MSGEESNPSCIAGLIIGSKKMSRLFLIKSKRYILIKWPLLATVTRQFYQLDKNIINRWHCFYCERPPHYISEYNQLLHILIVQYHQSSNREMTSSLSTHGHKECLISRRKRSLGSDPVFYDTVFKVSFARYFCAMGLDN